MAHSSNNGKRKNNEELGGKPNKNDSEESVATSRVRRGRPVGSKNKPKQPIQVRESNDNAYKTRIIQFESGVNIAQALLNFSKHRQMGLSILSAKGAVMSVTLSKGSDAVMVLNGRFDIISLHGSFLPIGLTPTSWLTIFLASGAAKGTMIGGTVMGPMIASGPVTVIVASFQSAIYEILPLPADDENAAADDDEELSSISLGHSAPGF